MALLRFVFLTVLVFVACSSKTENPETKLQSLVDKVCECENEQCAKAALEKLDLAMESFKDEAPVLKYYSAAQRCLAK